MFQLGRRFQLSIAIPFIFTAIYTLRFIQLSQAKAVTPELISTQVITLIIEVIIIYFLSVFFFSLENIIKAYITDPQSPESQSFKSEFKQATSVQKMKVLEKWDNTNSSRKITRSVVLQSTLVIFAVYAMTNTDSLVGIGVALSILLQTLVDQILLLRNSKDASVWFWQINRNTPRDIQTIYVGIVSVLFVAILTMLVR